MDTHVAHHIDIPDTEPALTARLPDGLYERAEEGSPAAKGGGVASGAVGPNDRMPSSSPAKRRKGRGVLLAGVAGVALVAAGGAFLISPYNSVYPVPRMVSAVRHAAAQAGVNFPTPLAPAASLASMALPPPPAPVVREKHEARPRDAQLSEILALHPAEEHPAGSASRPAPTTPATPPPPTTARPDGPPPGYVPSEPGSIVAQQQARSVQAGTGQPRSPLTEGRDATAAIIASLDHPNAAPQFVPSTAIPATPSAIATPAPTVGTSAVAPPPASPAPPVAAGATTAMPAAASPAGPAPTPAAADAGQPGELDVARVARELRAAPMSSPEQVQVLGLVTQMAAMVRDLKGQNAQLRSDLARTVADNSSRLADFERRLELSEARRAIAAAEDAGTSPAPAVAAPVVTAPVTSARAIPISVTTGVQALPPASEPVKAYRVQAASPGLAMLAQVDRGGGDGAQIQVQVGDTLPGYGKVKSVTQRGVAWVVNTERGVIGQ